MRRPEHEIAGRAVPGTQLQIHRPHAHGSRVRTADRGAVINDGPHDRRRPRQPEQHPAEPERDDPEHEDEDVAEDHGDRQHDEVDQERKDPPRQYAATQFGLRVGIERMRPHPAIVSPSAVTGIARAAIRHDPSSRPNIPEANMGTGGAVAKGRRSLTHRNIRIAKRGYGDFVIPGWSEGPDPESRDSGFASSTRPGMSGKKLTPAP